MKIGKIDFDELRLYNIPKCNLKNIFTVNSWHAIFGEMLTNTFYLGPSHFSKIDQNR